MSAALRLIAPAKVNWTLEVLGKRPDSYHEVRTLLQTISLADTVTLREHDEVSLVLEGAPELAGEPVVSNLAYRAARLLRERGEVSGGAEIEIEKNVPVAAGLGGGSSDAAAVLRGLRELWQIEVSDEGLALLAAELGSDVPFFLRGGTAIGSGRGEQIERLPDVPRRSLVVARPNSVQHGDKTARLYNALKPQQYTNGFCTDSLVRRLRSGEPIRDEDICSAFEGALARVDPRALQSFDAAAGLGFGPPHLCGAGPTFFFLRNGGTNDALIAGLEELGLRAYAASTIGAAEAVSMSTP